MGDFKENINSWSPKEDEWTQDSDDYKGKLDKYATTISDLLNKKDERLIGTFDIESTLLNGRMDRSTYPKYNTANPGAIALIRFLKEQKKDQYESSIASIASAEGFDVHKLLDQDTFFKNDDKFSISIYNKNNGFKSKNIEDIKSEILEKIDETQKEKMNLLLPLLNLGGRTPGALAKKYSVVFEALYRRFILDEKNINMLFFDNDIGYIDSKKSGITNFLDSKLSDTKNGTVRDLLTGLDITITPICAASGHITFEKTAGEDYNQPRRQAVFLNDLAREVMAKQNLKPDEIDKKMLEAEKICFEEYVSRDKLSNLATQEDAIRIHINDLNQKINKSVIVLDENKTNNDNHGTTNNFEQIEGYKGNAKPTNIATVSPATMAYNENFNQNETLNKPPQTITHTPNVNDPNYRYTKVYASNNGAKNEAPEKIISPSVNSSFKTDQPIDKNISKDYSNPYIAKLKELQEKAQKIGIFSRITLAIFSWFSSSSAKKRSAIKKLKTISIKNEDKPSYKNDKEMYDLLKDCLDGAKSFVSNIPEEPLEKNQIYDHEKHNKASQTDVQDSSKHRSNLNQSRATTNYNNYIY